MPRINSANINNQIGKKVKLYGWVQSRRDHGKIIFIDLRDRGGVIQIVVTPEKKETYKIGDQLKPEYVVLIEGIVNKRPKGMENPKILSGSVEVLAEKIEILNTSKTPPFEIDEEKKIDEALRLKYRYLDLRKKRLRNNLLFRHKVIKFIRDFLDKEGFWEVETPLLTKSTPEGARDFLVPSRLQPGKFYALPQSPQQYKQLLMVAGVEKYFQIARCLRDEDQRGDRQAEHTQLDLEMSFCREEDIREIIERLFTLIVKKLTNKKIMQEPFPIMSYDEAMRKYKTDKPDLRKNKDKNELAFCWIVDFPLFEWNEDEKRMDIVHHPFCLPKKEDMSFLEKEPLKVRAHTFDLVCNGIELATGSLRIYQKDLQMKIFSILGYSKEQIEKDFGHLLSAFEYGAPPHGGIAPGIDRFLMILCNEPNIREVIPFPKTGDGQDLMMGAPCEVSKEQLRELKIKTIKD